jgi:type II secretory pathway pseudopilin PulG
VKPASHLPSTIYPFSRRKPARAFTIIELLVVIGIIALLGALLVMGIGHLIRSAKVNAAKADLENAHSMFDEMNSASRLSISPNQWLWRNLPATPVPFPNAAFVPAVDVTPFVDFWKVPWKTPDPGGGTNPIADCLDAQPGTLSTDNLILRNGSRAVLNTQLAMRVILAYPANKAALSKLPADRWMIPTWFSGSLPTTGADGILGTGDDAADTAKTVFYAVGNCVQDLDQKTNPPVMRTYRCVVACNASTAPEPYLDNGNTNWVLDSNPTPILLDAWNNPIIFVPASGLINVYSNVVKSPPHIDAITALPNSPAGPLTLNLPMISTTPITVDRLLPPLQSPDHRPFFVSAGPDGDLSTGDDNLYSYEK